MLRASKRTRIALCKGIVLFLLTVPCQAQIQEACVPAPDGLVGWWDADSVSENTASNIAGGNDGIMQGGVEIVPGMVGNAFSLDGGDDYVDMGGLSLTGDWTVDFWINLSVLPDNTCCQTGPLFYPVGFKDDGSSDSSGIFVASVAPLAPGRVWGIYEGGMGGTVVGSAMNTTDEWNHLTVTKQGTTYSLYRNGKFETSGTLQNLEMPIFNIGRRSDDFFYVNGLIDEVEVFNRDLSAEEVASIFSAGSAGKCKPLAFNVDIPTLGNYGRALFLAIVLGLAIILLRRGRFGGA